MKYNSLRAILVSLIMSLSVLITPSFAAADEDLDKAITERLVGALKSATTQGFFVDATQYNRVINALGKHDGKDFYANPLTDEEVKELENIVAEMRKAIPLWMERLIANAKAFETRGEIKFKNPNWEKLADECIPVGSPTEGKTPFEDFIAGLEKMKNGQSFDWPAFQQQLLLDGKDCRKQLEVILNQVVEARKAVQEQLEALSIKIQKKEEECRDASSADVQSCKDELDDLYEEFEDKTETETKMKEFEDDSKKTLSLLGALAIIAGVAIGVYCCPNIGASIAAWGGETLEENQNSTYSKAVTETRKTGRKRDFANEGDATDAEQQALKDELAAKGFKLVEVDDSTTGGVAYQVVQSDKEIRVYLVKSRKLLARIDDVNTTISNNSRNIYSISAVINIRLEGSPFVEDNRIKLNINGTGPDSQPIKVSIAEKAVGSKEYSLTVE